MSEDDIFGGPPIDMSWADLGRINDEGYVDTDPVNDDPRVFEDQFELRSREKERQPSQLRPVTIVPNRAGPWSGNNQLGIEQGFAPDVNNRQTILKLDEWGFPELWTVVLGVDFGNPNELAANAHFEATATLQFGIGGVVQEIEVDWKNGTAITLPMNALNVIATYASPRVGRAFGTIPTNLRLRVSLAKGSLPSTLATRTISFTNNAPVSAAIPKFAKSLLITPTRVTGVPFTFYSQPWDVSFRSNPGGLGFAPGQYAISQCVSFIDATNQFIGGPMWLPVPPFARFVVLENVGVTVAEDCNLIFKLCF